MIVSEAAAKVLSLLEQEDQEEYTYDLATTHVIQALHELSEENEFRFHNEISEYMLTTPSVQDQDQDSDDPNMVRLPAYWMLLPGRAPLTSVLGVTWSGFSYIKRAWINVEDETYPFAERAFEEIMDTFGDNEGIPESFAIDGEYFNWRPIAPIGTDYIIRVQWQKMPDDPGPNDEPVMLAQIPYGVIYRACMVASVWLLDDNRVPMFKALSQEAFDRYNIRHSMIGDSSRAMEDFNG
jgi:hypothetical protein